MSYYVGVDLGQSNDYTAIAVIEAVVEEEEFHLRHLERYPLRMPYNEQADSIARLMREPELVATKTLPWEPVVYAWPPTLLVDATGVGKAVIDILKERRLRFRPITITGGEKQRGNNVPKRDLVAALEVPFHSGGLKVAEGLELWPVLKKELLTFRRKINLKTAHDSYEHWRESDHDDLVLAAALACWGARRPTSALGRPVPREYVGFPKPPGF
jgi:hypothetical protein